MKKTYSESNNMAIINISFYFFLILFIQVIISDAIIYFFDIKYIIAQIIALLGNTLINVLLIIKKRIKIRIDFSKYDTVFLILFVMITVLTIIFPDESYDTFSYHIYLQKNAFQDKITNDFFPGRTLTTYTYPIVDRLYYLFRCKLGFRLGVLPSYLVIITIFYQIKKYLKKVFDSKISEMSISLLSILPLCAFIVLQQVGTYYIDNICLTLLLEFTYIIIFETENMFKEKMRLYYLAFLCGLLVSCKYIMAFYMVLPLIYVLIKNRKDIKLIRIYDYIFLLIVAFSPIVIYMIDAIIDTGSPVFPYYNALFKSKYFGNYNWLDTEVYGARNIFQVVIWPLYISIFPYRGYNLHQIDLNYLTGWIVSWTIIIGYIVLIIKKKSLDSKLNIDTTNLKFALIILYYNFVLAQFCIGYVRYGNIIPVLSGILIIKLIFDTFKNKKIPIAIFLSCSILAATLLGTINFNKSGKLCYYNGLFNNSEEIINRIKINASCIFKDQDYLKYDIDGVWGVIGDESGTPSMLNIDDRIVQLRGGVFSGESEQSQEIYMNNILNNDIFVPIHELKLNAQIQQLNENGFQLTELVDIIPNALFLLDARQIYIFKVKYNPDSKNNNAINFNELVLMSSNNK